MAGHDDYGKHLLMQTAGDAAEQYGSSLEVDYGAGQPARIDGTVGKMVAVEFESRVSKQVRGAVLDFICHPYPKKLLALLPVHISDPTVTAVQCRNILRRFCPPESFRVLSTERRRRRLWLEASIRTSLRTLAISIATSMASAGIESEMVMVALSGMRL